MLDLRRRIVRLRVVSAVLGFAIATLLSAGTAAAAPPWEAPKNLSASGKNAFLAQVGIDAGGEAVAVWDCTSKCGPQTVQSASRSPSGLWSAIEEREEEGYVPELDVAPNGFAGAVWWKGGFGTEGPTPGTVGHVIKTSFRSGGAWSLIETTISGKEDEVIEGKKLNGAYFPHVAVDAKGDAVAVWQACFSPEDLPTVEEEVKGEVEVAGPDCSTRGFEEVGQYVIRASFRPPGGTWSKPVTLSKVEETAIKAKVAMDEKGNAIVVWEGDELPFNFEESPKVIYAGVLHAGQPSWSVKQISPVGDEAGEPEVAFDGAGNAVAIFHARKTPASELLVESTELKAGATTWSSTLQVSDTGQSTFEPQLAVDPAGKAVAIWRGNSTNRIEGRTRTGGLWSPSQQFLSAAGEIAREPRLDADADADAVAVWRAKNGSETRIKGSLLPAGGTWSSPVDLSEPGQNASEPDLDVNAHGSAIASWRRFDGSNEIIQSSFVSAALSFQAQSIPTAGAAGAPVSFSVSPVALWPGIVTTWNFGDGKTAQGNAVSHTYAKGGTYKVTVTSTDGPGNSATASGEITVAAGTAWISQRVLKVSGNRARVPMMCNSVGACNGTLKLVRGPKARRTGLGKADFSIEAGKARTVTVVLSGKAKNLLAATRRNVLSAAVEGSGVRQRSVVLKGKRVVPNGKHSR